MKKVKIDMAKCADAVQGVSHLLATESELHTPDQEGMVNAIDCVAKHLKLNRGELIVLSLFFGARQEAESGVLLSFKIRNGVM